MGFGGLTVIGTAGDGWCTLGDRKNIGYARIVGCWLEKGILCLDITLRIEQTGMLLWEDGIADGGVTIGVTTLGGGDNGTGGDATGGGTTLGGSIEAVTGGDTGWVVGALDAILLRVEALRGGPSC